MTTNNRIKISDLDYSQIRDNLKTFMQGQSQFSDYNFEGSALSVLLDVLAYNTHYNALYTNLAVNEMFLDSASKRSSVVSIAHNYGYIPKSSTSAKAIVNVTVTQVGATAQFKYLPKFSVFTSNIDNTSYSFYTNEDYTAELQNGIYVFSNVELYEGLPQTALFVCTEENEKFSLPNKDIDISTMSLTVQETGEQPDYVSYSLAADILDLTATSEIYYIKELEDETYQIYFGSNNLGKPILPGNIITAQYIISNKQLGNGGKTFTYGGSSLGGVTSVTTITNSIGGDDKETIDEIKYNVSRSFYNQNRAVTAGDYGALIKKLYSDVESVSVWGGEENYPPQYGKVFIAIKPISKAYLTPSDKSYITQNIIKSKNIVSITPVIIDPTYLQLEITSAIYYDKNKTTRSSGQIISAANSAILKYRDNNLRKFDGVFRMSKLSTALDSIDQSVLSNITTFKIYSEVTPKYSILAKYELNLNNPIYSADVPEEAFKSTGFYIDNSDTIYYLDDDGVGNIRLYSITPGTGVKVIKNAKIGTVVYTTGIIDISGLYITRLFDPNFYFIIKTQSYDVICSRHQVIDIPSSRINISAIQDSSSSGVISSNYKFSSSRS